MGYFNVKKHISYGSNVKTCYLLSCFNEVSLIKLIEPTLVYHMNYIKYKLFTIVTE